MTGPATAPASTDVGSPMQDALADLRADGHVRAQVPGGWLSVDRPLPFLCVYRHPDDGGLPDAERLVRSQASWLTVSGEGSIGPALCELVAGVAAAIEESEGFGSFLVIELWTTTEHDSFRVLGPPDGSTTVDSLADALGRVETPGEGPGVEVVDDPAPAPPGAPPLCSPEEQRRLGTLLLGVEVPAVHLDPAGASLPMVLRALQRDLARALQRTVFEFAHVQTSWDPRDERELGPRRLSDALREVDHDLADIAVSVDFLLAVTPVDADVAWDAFRASRYEREPRFHYRPLTVDPDLLKRRLYAVPIEEVEDPTLAGLFREKRHELDEQIDLLARRGSRRFLPTSLGLYGSADEDLVSLAGRVVAAATEQAPRDQERDAGARVEAEGFAERARDELDRYRLLVPGLDVGVEIREDVTGVMVDHGRLLVDARLDLPARRLDGLIQHEVGTHVLTALNGDAQPLRLLRVGLPDHEETQEALAVLAEFVVDALTPHRMTTLAARVIAVDALVGGASFVDTFRTVREQTGLSPSAAFNVAMRVHRGGGFTKDVIYLRGLRQLLAYLADGGSLDPLLVGKLSLGAVPVVEELSWREVLTPGALRPRWLEWPHAGERLTSIRNGLDVVGLLDEVPVTEARP